MLEALMDDEGGIFFDDDGVLVVPYDVQIDDLAAIRALMDAFGFSEKTARGALTAMIMTAPPRPDDAVN